MRTMNKIVALALVLAMAFSMMASAASFKDQATINADLIDEINLLVNLGVYSEQGTGAGYFEPNATITRAQAAKIIYVLKNKGVDNGATSWTGLNIFNDVEAGAWYEGYVNYCASTGIIAGVGDNKFAPNETLTGVQLAKMLLVVIGYKADVEGYTGNQWDANILADAEAAGFFVDYELSVKGIVSREWAAKMIVNAIRATKVRYEDGSLVEMYNGNNPVTYEKQDLGLLTITGVLVETPNIKLVDNQGDETPANNSNGKNKDSVVWVGVDEDDVNVYEEFEYAADPALLGSFVDVLVKSGSNKVYGITADEENLITNTTVDAVEYDADDFAGIKVFEDYKEIRHDTAMWGKNDNREVSLVDWNDDGVYDVALVAGVQYGQVEYTNPAKYIVRIAGTDLNNINTKSAYNKINFVDTVEKGDVVKITKDYTSGKLIRNVEKLDVVEGAITRVSSDDVVTIDGATYELGAMQIISDADDFALTVNKTVQEYFIDGKYIIATDELASANDIPTNVALLIDAAEVQKTDSFGNDATGTTKKVEVILNDGTQAIYTYNPEITDAEAWDEISTNNGVQTDVNPDAENKIYEYVIKSGKIGLIAIDEHDETVESAAEFDKDTDKIKHEGTTYRTNDESFFFVIDEDDNYAVVAASEIKTNMTLFGKNFIVEKDGFKYIVAGVLKGEVADDTKVYGIAANAYDAEIDEEEEDVIYIDVTSLAGTTVTLKVKEADFDAADAGKFVEYEIDADGYATMTAYEPTAKGYKQGALTHVADDGLVIVTSNATKDLVLADDVKIYYVDAFETSDDLARVSVTDGDGFVPGIETNENRVAANVLFKTEVNDGVEEITHIIVEVNGDYIWTNAKINTENASVGYFVVQ